MALYHGITKKGRMTGSKGPVMFERFYCSPSVDENMRAFRISLVDDKTGKKHSIVIYGEDLARLQDAIVKNPVQS